MATQIVILAAGQGKRMVSVVPKVLHPLGGKTILEHVVQAALKTADTKPPIVIYGHQGELLKEKLATLPVQWIEQKQQLGTGHALLQAMPALHDKDRVVVLCGDVPLISDATLKQLIATPVNSVGVITANLKNPFGYGRIKRNKSNKITGIIEEKDATATERKISEINTGLYVFPAKFLKKALPKIKNTNKQKEFYLPDVIAQAVKDRLKIHSVQPEAIEEIMGINDRTQLVHLERYYQLQLAKKLMQEGVTLSDPARIDIRGSLRVGQDVSIDINFISEGNVVIDNDCTIGPNCLLRNVIVGKGVTIHANSIIDGAEIAAGCSIGPFARIRPETYLAEKVHIGNFVEIKKSTVSKGSKINHLSYIGDTEVGASVNIGAGTITCNYDGINKHKTTIGDEAFIGSCTQLVAPVTIGVGATIGAGSTITEDAPPHQLTLSRAQQTTVKHWTRPKKEKV